MRNEKRHVGFELHFSLKNGGNAYINFMTLNLDIYNQNNFIPHCSFPYFKIQHKDMTESISYGGFTHGCSVVYMPVVVENTSGGIQMVVVDCA